MEYKVLYGDSPNELNEKISTHLQDGWKLSGSHQVVIRRQQNRFRGDQHVDTLNELEYSQTITREIKKNVIEVDIAFYHPEDENGIVDETIKVYDEEGMLEEFEYKLKLLVDKVKNI
jgi:hypothetical protein